MTAGLKNAATLFLLACISFAAPARAQIRDTLENRTAFLTTKDLLLAGGFAAATVVVSPADRYFAHRLRDSTTQSNRWLHGAATGFRLWGSSGVIASAAGLYLIGKASDDVRTADLGLHSAEAILIADVIGGGMKVVFGRARPYVDISNPRDFQLFRGFKGDDYRSFPSGHTINAFAFASSVSRETEIWWPQSRWYLGTLMYGGATLVGLSRMYNNDHWASDVIGGAAVGTIVGLKVVKFQHSHPGNRIDRALLSVTVAPQTGARPRVSIHF